MKPTPESVLCYVDGSRAYFTTAPILSTASWSVVGAR